jgi:integrase
VPLFSPRSTCIPGSAMRILRHAQIDVTMNVYTEVSDARTLKALKRLGRQLGS